MGEVIKQESIKTIFGKFSDNSLIDYQSGEIIDCITYNIHRNTIQNKEGFFNLRKSGLVWIIFQYLLLD